MKAKFKILASFESHINLSEVWIQYFEIPSKTLINIKHENKSIWVEAHSIDKNFRINYNQPPRINIDEKDNVLVANEWFREKLGIYSKETVELTIKKSGIFRYIHQIQAAMIHPDGAFRLSVNLAILSVLLGVLGLVIAFCHK